MLIKLRLYSFFPIDCVLFFPHKSNFHFVTWGLASWSLNPGIKGYRPQYDSFCHSKHAFIKRTYKGSLWRPVPCREFGRAAAAPPLRRRRRVVLRYWPPAHVLLLLQKTFTQQRGSFSHPYHSLFLPDSFFPNKHRIKYGIYFPIEPSCLPRRLPKEMTFFRTHAQHTHNFSVSGTPHVHLTEKKVLL